MTVSVGGKGLALPGNIYILSQAPLLKLDIRKCVLRSNPQVNVALLSLSLSTPFLSVLYLVYAYTPKNENYCLLSLASSVYN